jgi:hypothetical protein
MENIDRITDFGAKPRTTIRPRLQWRTAQALMWTLSAFAPAAVVHASGPDQACLDACKSNCSDVCIGTGANHTACVNQCHAQNAACTASCQGTHGNAGTGAAGSGANSGASGGGAGNPGGGSTTGGTSPATCADEAQFVCDEYIYEYSDGCWTYDTFEDCVNALGVADGCGVCSEETAGCARGHNGTVRTCTGRCTGANGSEVTITALGVTQTCHSNWFYGWYPWVRRNADNSLSQGCTGPCY